MLIKTVKKPSTRHAGTADPAKIARLSAVADAWWDPHGAFKGVRAFNQVRVDYLSQRLPSLLARDPGAAAPLNGLKSIDVGCGVGMNLPRLRWGLTADQSVNDLRFYRRDETA